MMRHRGRAGFVAFVTLGSGILALACSSGNHTPANPDAGANASCTSPPMVSAATTSYCASCSAPPTANPTACSVARPVDACCTWIEAPGAQIVRSTNLHYFSGPNPTPDFSCLTSPAAPGTPQMVTVTGHVKLFSSGLDSAGVKVEILTEGPDGSLGTLVGAPYTTVADDTVDPAETVDWLQKCQQATGGSCNFRSYVYANVPTETRLIIHTSDALGAGMWADLYDYNIYFSNSDVTTGTSGPTVTYDASAVDVIDIATVASAAGGFHANPSEGMLAGEVHDCTDARVSGAMVDTDLPHEGPLFYFTDDETDPLPDSERAPAGLGTSDLGLFGALNFTVGTPIRVTAIGQVNGQLEMLGTYTVQTFANSVTALSLRGRRPWQM